MLTPAQYKALKAWPDGVHVIWDSQGLSLSFKTNICDLPTFYALLDAGFILLPRRDCIRKRQPACDNAIREYEEVHDKDGE